MASIVGKYQHYKSENFDAYVQATVKKASEEVKKNAINSSPLLEVSREGDTWTLTNSTAKGQRKSTFTLGKPYEETLFDAVSTNVFTQPSDHELHLSMTLDGSEVVHHYTFSDSEVVITHIHPDLSEPAKRFFKRV